MNDTMTQTYSPDNEYERKATQYRSQVGDNPEAIKQAAAKDLIANNQELQGAIGEQSGAVDAMGQLAAYDQELAGKFAQTAQQKTQQVQDVNAFTKALGTGAQGTFTVDQLNSMLSTPEGGILSPFTSSGLVGGEQSMQQGKYDLAGQRRGSLERAIGTEAQSIASIAETQLERERLEAERKRAEARQRYEDERQYAMLMGGTVINPDTGKEEKYESPEEKAARENQAKKDAEQSVLQKIGTSGKTLLEEVIDGNGSFIDIIRQNPGLTPEEVVALANANVQKFGQFQESNEELAKMGLGILTDPKLRLTRESNEGVGGDIQGYVDLVKSGQMSIGSVPSDVRDQVVNAVGQAGGITEQEKPSELSESDKKFYRNQNIAKEESSAFLSGLDRLEELTKDLGLLNVFNQADPRVNEFNTLKATLTRQVARLFEKGVLTDNDVAFYEKLVPQSFIGMQGQKQGKFNELRSAVSSGLSKSGLNPEQVRAERAIADDLRTNAPDEINQYRSQLQPGEELFYDTTTGTYQAVSPTEAPLPGFVRI